MNSNDDIDVSNGRRVFLQCAGLGAFVLSLDSAFPPSALAAIGQGPELLGVSSAAVLSFLEATAKSPHELHSFLVARRGEIAVQGYARPYRANAPQLLYSLSKSFTSTAVGFAVTAGKLNLSDKVIDFFPKQLPSKVSANLAALKVEHLLTMSVGHVSDSTPVVTHTEDWVKTFLSVPIESQPGSVFLYDSAASYMLSAIVQNVVGQKVVDYLRPRFFDPLGLPEMRWQVCPRGINSGGWGLSATTDTLFRFGQFYLQKGVWKGRQLLPKAWVEQATTFKIQQPAGPGQDLAELKKTSDWHQGYGYQFWRCRNDAFRGDGAFGQFCIVLPKLDAVIAITSRTLDMQGLIDLVWTHLLPGMYTKALVADASASRRLHEKLDGLTLKPPEGSYASPPQGKSFDYSIEANALGVQRVSIEFGDKACRITFDTAQKHHEVTCGIGHWVDGVTELPGTPPEFTELVGSYVIPKVAAKLAAAGAWKDANTFEMQWRYYETPHFDTVTLHFGDKDIEVRFLNSLTQMAGAAHPETRPLLKGTARS